MIVCFLLCYTYSKTKHPSYNLCTSFVMLCPLIIFILYRNKSCFFTIQWQKDGTAGIMGSDEKFLSNKQSGILYSTGKSMNEDINKFTIIIRNRPILVLKCEFGFVGSSKGNQYSCNKAKYDTLSVTSFREGAYTIKGKQLSPIIQSDLCGRVLKVVDYISLAPHHCRLPVACGRSVFLPGCPKSCLKVHPRPSSTNNSLNGI